MNGAQRRMKTTTTVDQSSSSPVRTWAARHQLLLFVALAFGISWSIWPLVLANPQSSPLIPFGPAIAAVAVCAWTGGRRSLVHLLGGLTKFAVHPGWYAAALAIPAVAAGGALAASVIVGAPMPSGLAAEVPALALTVAAAFVIVGLFEELGWRGYLLPQLQRRRTALQSALIVGLIWLPWHLPEFVSDPSQRPLAQFAVLLLSQSVILAWLYNSTGGSLPIAMLCHAAYNSLARFFLGDLTSGHYVLAWWVMSGLTLFIAVGVVWHAGGSTLNGAEVRRQAASKLQQ